MRFEMFRARSGGMGGGNIPKQEFPKPDWWVARKITSTEKGVTVEVLDTQTEPPKPTKPPTSTSDV